MENETEVIREQMTETRTALTEKLEALEEHVAATVQSTTATVTETIDTVKEAVQGTVDTVSETVQNTVDTVKDTFDISQHVRNHPWAMVGGAVAVGFLAGRLLPGTSSPPTGGFTGQASSFSGDYRPAAARSEPLTSPSGRAGGSDWLSGLTQAFGPALQKLEGMAIGALTGMVGEMVVSSVPEEYRSQIKEVVNDLTTNLGGVPRRG